MPFYKLKTLSSAKKRFKPSKGRVLHTPSNKRHNLSNKSASFKRKSRKSSPLYISDKKTVLKHYLPYA